MKNDDTKTTVPATAFTYLRKVYQLYYANLAIWLCLADTCGLPALLFDDVYNGGKETLIVAAV